jgi:arylsulfatase A-like enzyme
VPASAIEEAFRKLARPESPSLVAVNRALHRLGNQLAVRTGNWKLVRNDMKPAQLYDLAADIGEATDLSAKYPPDFQETGGCFREMPTRL